MSNTVKIASKLGKEEETNGLDSWSDSFVGDDQQICCALVWLKVREVTINASTHEKRPTVEIVRIEPFGSPEALDPGVIEAYFRAYKERTGASEPLPITLTEALPHE